MNRTTRLRRFILIFAFTTYACSNATADVSENFEAGHRAIGGSIQIANDFGPELKVTERSNQFTLDIVPWFLFFRPNGQAFRLSPSLGVEINQLYWGGAAIDVDVGIGLSYIKYIHRFADETGRVPYFGIGTALIFYPVYSGAIIDEFTYDRVLDAYLFIEPEVGVYFFLTDVIAISVQLQPSISMYVQMFDYFGNFNNDIFELLYERVSFGIRLKLGVTYFFKSRDMELPRGRHRE